MCAGPRAGGGGHQGGQRGEEGEGGGQGGGGLHGGQLRGLQVVRAGGGDLLCARLRGDLQQPATVRELRDLQWSHHGEGLNYTVPIRGPIKV